MLTPQEHQTVLSELRLMHGRLGTVIEDMEEERRREDPGDLPEQILKTIEIVKALGLNKVAMMLEEDYDSMKKFSEGSAAVDSIT